MSEVPWYKEFFGEPYLRIYAPMLTPERTAEDVKGIVTLLALPPGSAILDLACGHGRHAIPLAEQGYQVTGLDLSEHFLDLARGEAAARGVPLRWVHGDMREIPFVTEFDGVINMFTAFGYLESDAEDQRVFHQVAKALKPGGRFLMELIHRESLMRRYAPNSITRLADGTLVLEEHRFNLLTSRNEVRVTMLDPDGRRSEHHHAVRIYSLTELARMLTAVGLELKAYYGGVDGSDLTLDSRRLALVSQKT